MLEPTAPFFALKIEWRDPDSGFDLVEVRYTCVTAGEQPDWRDEDSKVLVPRGDGPLFYRNCAVELPCGIDGASLYSLHYYFLVVQHGRQRTLPVTSEAIVSREVAYEDRDGRCLTAALQWSVEKDGAPNSTRLVARSPSPALPARARSAPAGEDNTAASRLFEGRVWGPRGGTVYYAFGLQRPIDGKTDGVVWDTNGGLLWQAHL